MPVKTETFTRFEYLCEVCGRREVVHGSGTRPPDWMVLRLPERTALVFCPEHAKVAETVAMKAVKTWLWEDGELDSE